MHRLSIICAILGGTAGLMMTILVIIIIVQQTKPRNYNKYMTFTVTQNKVNGVGRTADIQCDEFKGSLRISDPIKTSETLTKDTLYLNIDKYQDVTEDDIRSWGKLVELLLEKNVFLLISLSVNTVLAGSIDIYGNFSPPGCILSLLGNFKYVFLPLDDEVFTVQCTNIINNIVSDTSIGLTFPTFNQKQNEKTLNDLRKKSPVFFTKLNSQFIHSS
jgi:hypothetical protein